MTLISGVAEALREAMTAHCAASDFDLEVDEAVGSIEVTTDDWTLSIEELPDAPIAFLSIDNEPDDEREYERALHDAIQPKELQALTAADGALDGAIVKALTASDDPFSQYLGVELGRAEGS